MDILSYQSKMLAALQNYLECSTSLSESGNVGVLCIKCVMKCTAPEVKS